MQKGEEEGKKAQVWNRKKKKKGWQRMQRKEVINKL